MYANASPHAAVTPPVSQPPVQLPSHALQQGQPQGVPAQAAQQQVAFRTAAPRVGAAFVTGAYQPSGDAAIDRMIAFEAACKRFGSLI